MSYPLFLRLFFIPHEIMIFLSLSAILFELCWLQRRCASSDLFPASGWSKVALRSVEPGRCKSSPPPLQSQQNKQDFFSISIPTHCLIRIAKKKEGGDRLQESLTSFWSSTSPPFLVFHLLYFSMRCSKVSFFCFVFQWTPRPSWTWLSHAGLEGMCQTLHGHLQRQMVFLRPGTSAQAALWRNGSPEKICSMRFLQP